MHVGSGAFAKRFGTLVMGAFGDGELLPPTVLFRGKGIRIPEAERAAWHPDVIVIFQPKEWCVFEIA